LLIALAASLYFIAVDLRNSCSSSNGTVNPVIRDVNISGIITTDLWVAPGKIQFVDQQTNLTIYGALSDWRLDNGTRKASYSVVLQNQHEYNVTCYVSGPFVWQAPFNAGKLFVCPDAGSSSMHKDLYDISGDWT
jgi:hypothetical protein